MESLVQYNDRFKTKSIGAKDRIADRILLLRSLSVNLISIAILHHEEKIEGYGKYALPLV